MASKLAVVPRKQPSRKEIRRSARNQDEFLEITNPRSEKTIRLPNITPKTENQKRLMNALFHYPLVVGVGPAGTGKSFIGAYVALKLLMEGRIDRIVLTRNPIPVGSSLGFFAGSEMEKMMVWLGPIIGTFKTILKTENETDGVFQYLVNKGKIAYVPMEVVKGSSFENTFIIVEESQECDIEQLSVLTTRVGRGSTIFLNGDIRQTNSKLSSAGFKRLIDAFEQENEYSIDAEAEWDRILIPVVEFEKSDIIRSDITRKVVSILEKYNL